jgi:hypothetical protein
MFLRGNGVVVGRSSLMNKLDKAKIVALTDYKRFSREVRELFQQAETTSQSQRLLCQLAKEINSFSIWGKKCNFTGFRHSFLGVQTFYAT